MSESEISDSTIESQALTETLKTQELSEIERRLPKILENNKRLAVVVGLLSPAYMSCLEQLPMEMSGSLKEKAIMGTAISVDALTTFAALASGLVAGNLPASVAEKMLFNAMTYATVKGIQKGYEKFSKR